MGNYSCRDFWLDKNCKWLSPYLQPSISVNLICFLSYFLFLISDLTCLFKIIIFNIKFISILSSNCYHGLTPGPNNILIFSVRWCTQTVKPCPIFSKTYCCIVFYESSYGQQSCPQTATNIWHPVLTVYLAKQFIHIHFSENFML